MKKLVIVAAAALAVLAIRADDIDLTAKVRTAGKQTVTCVSGTQYSTSLGVANVFDGTTSGDSGRALFKTNPTEENPIVVQYDVDPDWNPEGSDAERMWRHRLRHLRAIPSRSKRIGKNSPGQ